MSDEELKVKLEEQLDKEISDDNIDLVLEYMKRNVDSEEFDVSNVSYEKDAEGNFIVKFDGYEMTLPKDISINNSLYAINTAFNIESPKVTPVQPSSTSKNWMPRGSNANYDFNIAIDLEMYTNVIDKLSECKTELEEDFQAGYETSSLKDKLLTYHDNHYPNSYLEKYNNTKTTNSSLFDKIQMAVMYYLSIDQNLADGMDSIIDSIFSGEMQLMQMMYEASGDTSLSYEEYVALLNDSEEFFSTQRSQYLYQFMLQIDAYVAEYKSTQVPGMIDSVLEMFYYAKENPTQSLEEFKNSLAKDYWNKVGFPETTGDNSVLNRISSDYWYGTEENPTTDYDKFLLHVTFYDRDYINLCEILRDNYSSDIPGYNLDWIFPNDIRAVPSGGDKNYSEFGRLRAINSQLDDIYYGSADIRNEILDIIAIDRENGVYDFSKLTLEKSTELCERFQTLINNDNFNNFFNGDMFKQGQQLSVDKFMGMINDINWLENNFRGVIPGFNADTQNEAVIIALCEHYNITDESIIDEIKTSGSYDGDSATLRNIITKIYREDGYDGMCSFITSYYNNLKNDPQITQYLGEYVFGEKLTVDQIKRLLLSGTSAQNTFSITSWAWDQAGLISTFTNTLATSFRQKMAEVRSAEDTAKLYFMQKLDVSEVTEADIEKAKKIILDHHNNDSTVLKYIDDSQLKAFALLMMKNGENGDQTWLKYISDSKKSRGVFDELIVEGQAFDEAKDTVETLTAAGYIWATITGFVSGAADGVGNFIAGIDNFFNADGLISKDEYRQQFIHQFLTTDYSIFKNYNQSMLSSEYDDSYINSLSIDGLERAEVEEMIDYAKANGIPRYELEHMIGLLDDEEYTKYNAIASSIANNTLSFYTGLANKSWLTGYTNVVYTVGTGVGDMIIPIVLNTLSTYCPMLSYLSIGLTALSTSGKTREGLMQQGVTDQTVIWVSSILHGLIEGAGEAIFGGVLDTKWGKKIFNKLKKIPVLGKALTFTDDIIGKIDDLSFASETLKKFLKNDIKEVLEELGENAWGYVIDGFLGLGWPTGEEVLSESWQTVWQTALTTPILNAFSGTMNKHLRKTITVGGLAVTLSLADIEAHRNEDGSIDAAKLLSDLAKDGRLTGTIPAATNRLNRLFQSEVVESVEVVDDDGKKKYVVKLKNNETLEYDLESFDLDNDNLFKDIGKKFPQLLLNALNNENSTETFIQKMFAIYDSEMIPRMATGLDGKQMAKLINSSDTDTTLSLLRYIRPGQTTEETFRAVINKIVPPENRELINKYNEYFKQLSKKTDANGDLIYVDEKGNPLHFNNTDTLANLLNYLVIGDVKWDFVDYLTKMEKNISKEKDPAKKSQLFDQLFNEYIEKISKVKKLSKEEIENARKLFNKQPDDEKIEYLKDTLGDISSGELLESYKNLMYHTALKSLEMMRNVSENNGMYNVSYTEVLLKRYLARAGVYEEPAKVISGKNGVDYSSDFPQFDSFFTDYAVIEYTSRATGINESEVSNYARTMGIDYNSDPIAAWGTYLRNHPDRARVKGITFQNSASNGANYDNFGGNLGRWDSSSGRYTGGVFAKLSNLEEVARQYPDLCGFQDGNFVIYNIPEFGQQVLGGVVLSDGVYILEFDVPLTDTSMPSVNNGGMFTEYGAPGGYLHETYDREIVVSHSRVGSDARGLSPGSRITVPIPLQRVTGYDSEGKPIVTESIGSVTIRRI